MKKIMTLIIGMVLLAVATVKIQANPLLDFLNPTNSFLQANEFSLTLDAGYQKTREFSAGIGARFWISDSQGATISYEEFPNPQGRDKDSAEWQIGYGYRTAYKSAELDVFAGMADDVDNPTLLFRPYIEFDILYQAKENFGVGPRFQLTDGERPFVGILFNYKFSRK